MIPSRRFISHRGNLYGPDPKWENHPDYIVAAIDAGYDVEVDVWYDDQKNYLYLGHDKPEHWVSPDFFMKHHGFLWVHAKNVRAFLYMRTLRVNVFSHNVDDCAVVSPINWIWTSMTILPKEMLAKDKVILMATTEEIYENAFARLEYSGLCSDWIGH